MSDKPTQDILEAIDRLCVWVEDSEGVDTSYQEIVQETGRAPGFKHIYVDPYRVMQWRGFDMTKMKMLDPEDINAWLDED